MGVDGIKHGLTVGLRDACTDAVVWHGVSSSRGAFVGLRRPRGSGVFERSGVRLSPPEYFVPEARENAGTIAHTRPSTKHFHDARAALSLRVQTET
jgi:hypothetical protein